MSAGPRSAAGNSSARCPLKISAKEVLITARKPNCVRAQGACSRELPQPKLSPARRISAPCAARRVQDEIRLRISRRVVTPVAEELLVEPFFRCGLEKARRDNLVSIDVIGRYRHQSRFERQERLHRMVLTSVTTPVRALAAAVSGDARNVRPPLPCRPSKLRLLVETLYSPGWS